MVVTFRVWPVGVTPSVSGVVAFGRLQPTKTNESLIVLNQQEGSFIKTKRYDTFGNYTRYIPRGSRGMGNQPNGLPEEVKVSSFRYGNQFTIVVVNPTDRQLTSQLLLENGKVVKGSLRNYITTADKQWSEGTITGSVYCALYVQPQQDKVVETVVSDGGTYGFEISCSVHWYTV